MDTEAASNGIRFKMVQDTLSRLQATSTVYKGFVSSLEDVDMPQALAKLNQDQTALQATFQITATLNKLSLLNFIAAASFPVLWPRSIGSRARSPRSPRRRPGMWSRRSRIRGFP